MSFALSVENTGNLMVELTIFNTTATATTVNIDWGDTQSTNNVNLPGNGNAVESHTYAAPGTYTIVVTDPDGNCVQQTTCTVVSSSTQK